MDSCPKCGCTRISGPRYTKDFLGRERLFYNCARCGYVKYGPTLDQKQDLPAPFAASHHEEK